jgi:hypothetical protein
VLGLVAAEVGAADAAGDEVKGAGALVIDQVAWGVDEPLLFSQIQ